MELCKPPTSCFPLSLIWGHHDQGLPAHGLSAQGCSVLCPCLVPPERQLCLAGGHQAGRQMGVGGEGLCGRLEPDREGGGTPA